MTLDWNACHAQVLRMLASPTRLVLVGGLALVLGSCGGLLGRSAGQGRHVSREPSATAEAPPALLGEFADDYEARYTITGSVWRHASNRFHVIRWDSAGQFLVARNDRANSGEPGLYTRIDWLMLEGMPPYRWAYCYSAYKAPSADSAERTAVVQRETPRTGCNGYPFTRMKASPLP